MLAAPEGLAQDRDVSLTREHQTVLIVSLYTMSKAAAVPPTSDWTAKHSTVLGDLIGEFRVQLPRGMAAWHDLLKTIHRIVFTGLPAVNHGGA